MFGRVKDLEDRILRLEHAYNEFFDAVAHDLGYEAAAEWGWSPRRLLKTFPEIIRKPTARCKGKK